ncbi:hypothetical protein HNR39_000201 [Glaciimonas immobilis]|uniref:Uncharacterized protein n=1 Tax=Glaciimonas immobilis TaxID=728004 RepID=A0A840RP27_9BURK|nr:hypothetical protein [Glaciimonas immobilis]
MDLRDSKVSNLIGFGHFFIESSTKQPIARPLTLSPFTILKFEHDSILQQKLQPLAVQ